MRPEQLAARFITGNKKIFEVTQQQVKDAAQRLSKYSGATKVFVHPLFTNSYIGQVFD